jgi:hypothetical protein
MRSMVEGPLRCAVGAPPPLQMQGRRFGLLTLSHRKCCHRHVTPGWHPVGNKGSGPYRPLLLECDEAGELEFGSEPDERLLSLACIILS